MIKKCEVCGDNFDTNYKWARICKPCFIEEKKNEMAELEEAAAYWEQRAYSFAKQLEQASSIDPALLKKLIHLCHPDKHNGSDMAKEVTQWLLQQRK